MYVSQIVADLGYGDFLGMTVGEYKKRESKCGRDEFRSRQIDFVEVVRAVDDTRAKTEN